MDRTSREEWAKRVERWRDSGLTAAEFAAELGINAHSLSWWKWRLARGAGETRTHSPLVLAEAARLGGAVTAYLPRDDSTRAAGAARDRPGHRCSRPGAHPTSTTQHWGDCSAYWSALGDPDLGTHLRVHGATGHAAVVRRPGARGQGAARARSAEWRALRLREQTGQSREGSVVRSQRLLHPSASACTARISNCLPRPAEANDRSRRSMRVEVDPDFRTRG